MACKDCFDKCTISLPDGCVIYTGEDIPALGICQGQPLSEIDQIIIEKLLSALDGTGIVLADVTLANCPYLAGIFAGKDQTLVNLMQLLIDQHCSLKTIVDGIQTSLGGSFPFDIKCLTGVTTSSSKDEILQASINMICSVKTTVDAIPGLYVKLTDLETLVKQIVSNSSSTIQYFSFLPPKMAFPFFGELSNFDNTGKGIESKGFKGLYLCNGLNGTPDLRGRVVVGAIRNVVGGTIDTAVDPNSALNPNTNYSVSDKFGESYHTLSVPEIPSHGHDITDPGHQHNQHSDTSYRGTTDGGLRGTSDQSYDPSKKTNVSTTDISIKPTGGGLAHENRQPSIAAYWVIRL